MSPGDGSDLFPITYHLSNYVLQLYYILLHNFPLLYLSFKNFYVELELELELTYHLHNFITHYQFFYHFFFFFL